MTAPDLTAELVAEYAEVPATLIATTVEAAAAAQEDDVERVARTDVAALAEAVQRSGASTSR
jgi:hypothetical protein